MADRTHTRDGATAAHSAVLAFLLALMQIGYSASLRVADAARTLRQARDVGVVGTLCQLRDALWRLLGRQPAELERTILQPAQFTRLPHHLAFALESEVLDSEVDAAVALADLVQTCWLLSIPEITLFDHADFVWRSWPLVAAILSASLSAPATILVLQGAPSAKLRSTDDETSASSHALVGHVAIVYQGEIEMVNAAELMDESTLESSSEPHGAESWRARVRAHVSRRSSTLSLGESSALAIILVSCLGSRHSEQAVVDAALRLAENSTTTISPSPHTLRLRLQRDVLPLPLSEPDLLLVISPLGVHHRSLVGFPPWLLRVTEILHVQGLRTLTHGHALKQKLIEFARSVQRGGT